MSFDKKARLQDKFYDKATANQNTPRDIVALKTGLDAAFARTAAEFNAEGVTVVMSSYAPQQGRLLSDYVSAGGQAVIAGGRKGAPAFKNVTQYGQDFDTTAYLNMFPEGMSEQIVAALPEEVLRDRKVAVFSFIPPASLWASYLTGRDLNTTVVASNEQNTRQFFEQKGNLVHILREAGLDAYVIPTEVVQPGEGEAALRALYARMCNENGKVVVQPCVENYEPTAFYDNEDAFVARMLAAKGALKVVRFVEGSEANFSFLVGNTAKNPEGRGVIKANLPAGVDLHRAEDLALIEANAAAAGINDSNAFAIAGRATLKAVGETLLAQERCDSVGNNIGHVYEPHIARQITEIGEKLGRKMALCGKVGHAGADLIIDANGKIWINEINDRQQGPTDQMSADAESNGLPGLSRMAWFMHFADFSKPENAKLLADIKAKAAEIHQGYMTSSASYYIKAYATHAADYDGKVTAQKDLPSGVYCVTQKADGEWQWNFMGENAAQRPNDLSSGAITLRISAGSLKKGDTPPSGAEMFRITGVAGGDNSPFIIEHGISRLSPQWEPIIERLYKDCFGEDYLSLNPLRRPDAPTAKTAKRAAKPQAPMTALQKAARRQPKR